VGPAGFLPGVNCRGAAPGDIIAVYVTGLGTNTNPPTPAGRVVDSPAPMVHPVAASVAGKAAAVDWAGLVGAGLYQVNLHVPAAPAGDAAIVITLDGVSSQGSVAIPIVQRTTE